MPVHGDGRRNAWKEAIVAALVGATGCPNVYERSDVSIRQKEGLEQITGVLAGEAPSDALIASENGVRYHVDVRNGHKTRVLRRPARQPPAGAGAGEKIAIVLKRCFCYYLAAFRWRH